MSISYIGKTLSLLATITYVLSSNFYGTASAQKRACANDENTCETMKTKRTRSSPLDQSFFSALDDVPTMYPTPVKSPTPHISYLERELEIRSKSQDYSLQTQDEKILLPPNITCYSPSKNPTIGELIKSLAQLKT